MRIKSIVLLVFSIINLSSNIATAKPTPAPQSSSQSLPITVYEQQSNQIEELQRSQEIEKKVKEEWH